jgi:hypothetical protein
LAEVVKYEWQMQLNEREAESQKLRAISCKLRDATQWREGKAFDCTETRAGNVPT